MKQLGNSSHPSSKPLERLARTLRRLRLRRRWSRRQLAQRCGLTEAAIRGYEDGTRRLTLATLDRLLSAFGVDLGELSLLLEEPPPTASPSPGALVVVMPVVIRGPWPER